jgi:hypothetical protein
MYITLRLSSLYEQNLKFAEAISKPNLCKESSLFSIHGWFSTSSIVNRVLGFACRSPVTRLCECAEGFTISNSKIPLCFASKRATPLPRKGGSPVNSTSLMLKQQGSVRKLRDPRALLHYNSHTRATYIGLHQDSKGQPICRVRTLDQSLAL